MTDQKDVPVQCDAAKPVAWQWFWKSRGVWVNLNIEPSEKDLQEMKDNGIECRALYAARLTPAGCVSAEDIAGAMPAWEHIVEMYPEAKQLVSQVERLTEALRKIGDGTEDKVYPLRAMGYTQMRRIANEALGRHGASLPSTVRSPE